MSILKSISERTAAALRKVASKSAPAPETEAPRKTLTDRFLNAGGAKKTARILIHRSDRTEIMEGTEGQAEEIRRNRGVWWRRL